MKTVRISSDPAYLEEGLALAARLLQDGEIVAFPTETVYGLGANALDERAIRKIYEAKGRPSDNPLIVHVAKTVDFYTLAEEIPSDFSLLERFFPGPLTLVLKRNPKVPSAVSAGLPTIAIRSPSHPIALRLLALSGVPIAAPSANLSGRPSPTSAAHVWEDLAGKISLLLDGGRCEIGIESTVLSLVHPVPTLLRPGSISREELEEALGKKIAMASPEGPILSPGMKYRHYAPNARVWMFAREEDLHSHCVKDPDKRRLLLSLKKMDIALENTLHKSLSSKELYAHFRLADQEGMDEVCLFCDPSVQKDLALMNRILLASKEK